MDSLISGTKVTHSTMLSQATFEVSTFKHYFLLFCVSKSYKPLTGTKQMHYNFSTMSGGFKEIINKEDLRVSMAHYVQLIIYLICFTVNTLEVNESRQLKLRVFQVTARKIKIIIVIIMLSYKRK